MCSKARHILDAMFVLEHLFRGGREPRCLKSADVNDDGSVDLSDAVAHLASSSSRVRVPCQSPSSLQTVIGEPPAIDTFCNSSPVLNARNRLSGDQKGDAESPTGVISRATSFVRS